MITHYEMLKGYPDVLHPSQLEEILHIGHNTVSKLLKSGEIPSIKVGKLYRISKEQLIDYINGNYSKTKANTPMSTPKIRMKLKNYNIDVDKFEDEDYPGIDIEFEPENYDNLPENKQGTKARILIEWPKNEPYPRALIWSNANDENYTHCIPLSNVDGIR